MSGNQRGWTWTDEDAEREHQAQQQKAQAARDAEIDVIEGMLHALGARMMRPYEHWNEDERYMEWQERDR